MHVCVSVRLDRNASLVSGLLSRSTVCACVCARVRVCVCVYVRKREEEVLLYLKLVCVQLPCVRVVVGVQWMSGVRKELTRPVKHLHSITTKWPPKSVAAQS